MIVRQERRRDREAAIAVEDGFVVTQQDFQLLALDDRASRLRGNVRLRPAPGGPAAPEPTTPR